jgi:hypothetical protein
MYPSDGTCQSTRGLFFFLSVSLHCKNPTTRVGIAEKNVLFTVDNNHSLHIP